MATPFSRYSFDGSSQSRPEKGREKPRHHVTVNVLHVQRLNWSGLCTSPGRQALTRAWAQWQHALVWGFKQARLGVVWSLVALWPENSNDDVFYKVKLRR